MKTLVRKELRENVRLAALGLVVHTLMLVQHYREYVAAPTNMSQPLANPEILWSTAWFCGIFGAVLGWLQVHNERRPDLWAFLIHRPMTRTGIFLGKVTAGLGLYALVVCLPLLGFILWARLPGHVASPFEIAMLRPVAVYVLAGILYYFAGMLADLRQARWYASRVLGMGVAVVVSLLVSLSPALWQSLLLILIGAAILATAVWSGFQSDGHYRGQPAWGKATLTTALMMGCLIIAFMAAMLVSSFFPRSQPSGTSSDYFMTTNGTVLKSTQGTDRPTEIVDLEGKPVLDEGTGKPIDAAGLNRCVAAAITLEVAQDGRHSGGTWIRRDLSLAVPWGVTHATHDTLWYYWSRYGRLVAYDVVTRRCIGSLGPKGFAPYALTCLEKCLLPLQEKIFLRLAPARWFSQANGDSFPVLEHLLEGKPRAYRLDHLAKGKGKFPPAARVPRLPARCILRGKVRAPGPEPCRSTTPQTACRRAMLWRSPGPAWAGDRVGLSA